MKYCNCKAWGRLDVAICSGQNPIGTSSACSTAEGEAIGGYIGQRVGFPYGKYQGGHSRLGQPRTGNLWLTSEAIGLGTKRPKAAVVPLSAIASVEVGGQQVRKSKAGAVAAFGVLGLAAKGEATIAVVTVRSKDGETAYYRIENQLAVAVRGRMAPILEAAGIPLVGEESPPIPPPSADLATRIRELGALRDDGLITEEEFAAQKAKLLEN